MGALIKGSNLDRDRHTQGEFQLTIKVEIRVICLHSKEGQRLPANHLKPGQRLGTDSSSQPEEGTNPTNTFQFWLQNYKTIHSCCLIHLVSVLCYGGPGK